MKRYAICIALLTIFVAGCAAPKKSVEPLSPSPVKVPVPPPMKKLPDEVLQPSFLERLESILFPKPSEPTPSGSN